MIREVAARTVARTAPEAASITGSARWDDQYGLDPDVTYLIGAIPRVVQE